MPAQRKVFRIEQMGAVGTPGAAMSAVTCPTELHEIVAELKALRDLIERGAGHASDAGKIAANELRQLKGETDAVHRAIVRTEQEIAALHASAFNELGRPRITRELNAVVEGTERATTQILIAAEHVENAANSLAASVQREQEQALAHDIQDQVLRIFEACNFQDLSGQRIAKVQATLAFVEERIAQMKDIWSAEPLRDFSREAVAQRKNGQFMNGPKLDDEPGHALQADVDAILRAG